MAKTPAKRKVAITFEDDDDDDDDDDNDDREDVKNNIEEINGNHEGIPTAHGTDDDTKHVAKSTTSTAAAAVGAARLEKNDPAITKTPISSVSKNDNDNRTPGSSGGMIMRSGKKKKRPKPSGATSDIRRAQKRTKLTNNDDEDDDDHVGTKSGNNYDEDESGSSVEGEKGDEEELRDFPNNNVDMVAQPVANGNNRTLNHHGADIMETAPYYTTTNTNNSANTTAQKVPPAMTREAIAAAQVTESAVEEEDDDILEEKEQQEPAAVANTTGGGGILHLLSQKLRLPSQHTPKHPTTSQNGEESGVSSIQSDALAPHAPPPPGGRRLIFETASKTTATTASAATIRGAATATTTATAGGGKNKLLTQTRQQQNAVTKTTLSTTTTAAQSLASSSTTQTSVGRLTLQDEGEEGAVQNETNTATTTSLHTRFQQEWQQNKHQLILYTQRWFLFLLICFVSSEVFLIGSLRNNMHGGNSSTLHSRFFGGTLTTLWTELHDIISPFEAITSLLLTGMETDVTTPGGGDTSKKGILTDPVLLAKARAVMRAERMNLYDTQKLEWGMVEMQKNLNMLEDALHGWTVEYPDLADYFFVEEKDSSNENETSSSSSARHENVFSSAITTFLDNITSTMDAKRRYLLDWEMTLVDAERALDAYDKSEIPPSDVNDAILALSQVSMMKFDSAMILDLEEKMLVLPGEGCGGMDYIPLREEVVARIQDNANEKETDDEENEEEYEDEKHADGDQEHDEEYFEEEERETTEEDQNYDGGDEYYEEDQYDEEQEEFDNDRGYNEEDQYDDDLNYDDEQDFDEEDQDEEENQYYDEQDNSEDQDYNMEDQYDEDLNYDDEHDSNDEVQYDDEQDFDEEQEYDEEQDFPEAIEVNELTGEEKDFIDSSSDSPVRMEDAYLAYERLIDLAESTSEALFGDASSSSSSNSTSSTSPAKRWAQQIMHEELRRRGVDTKPPSIEQLLKEPITLDLSSKKKPSSSSFYTTYDAIRDIDHRLEIEDADRTGKFDYASVINGARVLRRGPFSTSYSYYETLPLLNRLLAYTKLRFYGHPPEVALYPTFPMHARGQCWSFSNETKSVRSRRHSLVGGTDSSVIANDLVGEYATLAVSLVSAVRVTEIVMEHPPSYSNKSPHSSSSSAVQEFRVLGFEDGGAFGVPWELGRYTFDVRGLSLQTFAIPTTLFGQNIPKLKAIVIAIDSNWGAEYGCLYRVRVHGD